MNCSVPFVWRCKASLTEGHTLKVWEIKGRTCSKGPQAGIQRPHVLVGGGCSTEVVLAFLDSRDFFSQSGMEHVGIV